MPNDSTRRFSNRVEDYVKYRPGYPAEIVSFLQHTYALVPGNVIADIGAGTGISTQLFLQAGYPVFAVEPNKEMREKAIALLHGMQGFIAINGTAENTGLEAKSIDAVVAGQAFHWFDREKARTEFTRILKENGIVALIWNERMQDSDFELAYDALILKHARDYVQVDHRNIDIAGIEQFFSPHPVALHVFDNKQVLDLNGLKGRLLSSSYMPTAGDTGYEEMIADLDRLFQRYQENGMVTIRYATKLYAGRLS